LFFFCHIHLVQNYKLIKTQTFCYVDTIMHVVFGANVHCSVIYATL
jgi:hypothetical protein